MKDGREPERLGWWCGAPALCAEQEQEQEEVEGLGFDHRGQRSDPIDRGSEAAVDRWPLTVGHPLALALSQRD